MKSKNYEEFVEKFKPKKTTDDCYTPPKIYDAVKEWAVAEYGLDGCEIVRPFFPGGDYENFDYPENCVVIDNPPFSILAQIKKFYISRGIKFFLFAPHLTLFSAANQDGIAYIITDTTLTYENGAKVNTSFVTNLDSSFIRTAPELRKALKDADFSREKTKLPKYRYPHNVISSALLEKIANTEFRVERGECYFIRQLDSQKESKKAIYGSGFLISNQRAAELRAAELRAAEPRAAEPRAAEPRAAEPRAAEPRAAELRAAELRKQKECTEWQLSEREKQIISKL